MLTGKKVVKNSIWIIAGQIYTAVFSFVISIFTANYLGPSNFGIIGYITSFVNFFSSVGCLGFTNILVKEIITHKNNEGSVVGTAVVLQFIALVISYGLTILTIYLFNIGNRVMLICAVLEGLIIVFRVFDNFMFYFQARLEAKYASIVSMVAYTIMQLYKIFLLLTNKSVEWFAAAQTIDVIVVALSMAVVYAVKKGPRLNFSKSIGKTLLKQGLPYMLMGTIALLYGIIDRVMLKEITGGTTENGIYDLAYSLSHFWSFVASAIVVSFSTMVYEASEKYGTDSEEYKLKMRQLYCVVFWICCIIAVGLSIVLPFFITYVYKDTYKSAIFPSIILTWQAVLAFTGSAKSVQLLVEEKQMYGIAFSVFAVAINVGMNFALIPLLGSLGAAIATIVSEAFIFFVVPFLFKKTKNIGITMMQGIFFRNVNASEIIAGIKSKIFRKRGEVDTDKINGQVLDCVNGKLENGKTVLERDYILPVVYDEDKADDEEELDGKDNETTAEKGKNSDVKNKKCKNADIKSNEEIEKDKNIDIVNLKK